MRTVRRLDGFELAVLAVLAALSLWIVASDVVAGAVHHVVWTRTDSFFTGDQLQYLAWIRSSAHHGLINDLYVLRPTPADYLQPAIVLSGQLVRLGVAPWLALMLWKPVGIVAIFLAARALVDRCLPGAFDRRIALVLALLFASLTDVGGSLGVFGDMISVWQSWGYPFGLLGVALAVFALLGYAAARDAGRTTVAPGLLGALAGTLHPWQGELLFGVIVLAELVRGPETLRRLRAQPRAPWRDPGLRLAAVTLALVATALAYYFALGHLDPVWRLGQAQARHAFSTTAVVLAAAPLLAFALLGYRGRPASFEELALRMWLPTAVIMWAFALTSLGAAPQHAVNGLPLPLAVLAVLGARRNGLGRLPHARWLAALGAAIGVVPGTVFMLAYAHTFVAPAHGNANFVTGDERRALAGLSADPAPGGVLAVRYLGSAVPGLTGRSTYVGDCLWSVPDCGARASQAAALLSGALPAAAAQRFATATGARFVLGDCREPPGPVTRRLGALVVSVQHYGCATVWRLRAPANGAAAAPGTGPA